MCGRLACLLNPEKLKGASCYLDNKQTWCCPEWTKSSLYEYVPFYNGPPTTTIPVLVDKNHCKDVSTDFALIPMHWGLIPVWKQAYDSSYYSFNARIESLTKSNMYGPELTAGHKCVVLADGFYEWAPKGTKSKQPHFVYQKPNLEEESKDQWNEVTGWTGKYMMKLAGIFNANELPNGQIRYSCSIITTDSDKTMSWLHHRMPITINSNKDMRTWLEQSSVSDAIKYLESSKQRDDKYLFKFKAVSSYVNNIKNNDEKCLEGEPPRKKMKTLLHYFKPKSTPE